MNKEKKDMYKVWTIYECNKSLLKSSHVVVNCLYNCIQSSWPTRWEAAQCASDLNKAVFRQEKVGRINAKNIIIFRNRLKKEK